MIPLDRPSQCNDCKKKYDYRGIAKVFLCKLFHCMNLKKKSYEKFVT